jgi:hypothetical protein
MAEVPSRKFIQLDRDLIGVPARELFSHLCDRQLGYPTGSGQVVTGQFITPTLTRLPSL